MVINQIIPQITTLNKSEKIRLLQYLVAEIAKDEGIDREISLEKEQKFWYLTSQPSLAEIWDHPDEEVYNELLEK